MCEWFTVRTFYFQIRLNFQTQLSHLKYKIMADQKNNPPQNQINIELSEEIAEGIYSNLAMIAHSNSEFVIDFIRLMPGVPKARVKAQGLLLHLSMLNACWPHLKITSVSTKLPSGRLSKRAKPPSFQ
jgi:hypothetical protein